jgi:hypothetical protein
MYKRHDMHAWLLSTKNSRVYLFFLPLAVAPRPPPPPPRPRPPPVPLPPPPVGVLPAAFFCCWLYFTRLAAPPCCFASATAFLCAPSALFLRSASVLPRRQSWRERLLLRSVTTGSKISPTMMVMSLNTTTHPARRCFPSAVLHHTARPGQRCRMPQCTASAAPPARAPPYAACHAS